MPGALISADGEPASIRLVVFDLDGTLIDSIVDIAASANEALIEVRGEGARLPQDLVQSFVGGGARQLIERCLVASHQPADDLERVFERFLAIYAERLTETTRLYPGMESTLDGLASSAALAVLTNKPGAMSRALLRELGLTDRFMAIIGGDDLASRKPDPEGLLKIVAEAGVSPRETVMVGDSAVDVLTARRAGVLAIGVSWGYDREGVRREQPDLLATKPSDLLLSLTDTSILPGH